MEMEFDPFSGPRLLGAVPTTDTQREIWTAAQVSGEANLAYNESVSVRLLGALDRPALEAALRELVKRHEALRATFSGDGLSMLVNESADVPLRDVDCVADPSGLARLLDQVVKEPFHLERGPLARAHLAKLSEREHVLVFTAHHIVCDGWSTAVIVREWAQLYSKQSLPPAPTFSAWAKEVAGHHASQAGRDDEAWWLSRFTGELPVLELPGDRPRPPLKTFSSLREDFVIDEALVARLKKAGAREKASLFAVLLAGFEALLHRLSGQEDVVVGIPSAGQSIGGYDGLVGHCVNMLPLRTRVDAAAPLTAFLGDVRKTLLDGQSHQLFTIGQLLQKLPVARDPSRLPLVSVIFNVDRGMTPESMPFEGLEPSLEANPRRFETYDLFLNAVELGGRVKLECQYNTDLFDAVTVRRWLAAYQRLLGSMASMLEAGQGTVGALEVLGDDERKAIAAFNAAGALDVDSALTVVDLLEEQARRSPSSVAVECEGRSCSYAELDARANAIAAKLKALGVSRGALVGICLERGVDLVAAVSGVLKSGAGYVPLDPGYPTERLAFMVADAGIEVLLTEERVTKELTLTVKHVLRVEDVPASAPPPAEKAAQPEDVAYVIFTSGSTGKPKGVRLPHRAVVNLLKSVQRTPGMTADDTVLAVTTLSFDIAVSEILLPLTVGARISLVTREVAADGPRLLQQLKDSKATFLDATPATYRLLLGAGWEGGDLKKCICTGEAMPRDLALELVKRVPSVWNGYGPTETCVWSTFWEVPKQPGRVLIGKPVANTELHVLDARRQPVLPGVVGELFIGGRGVALGYLNRPELTKERFQGGLYKTGDLVRLLPDGNLECLGRNDFQVKLRGFRIELGEIEDALTQHPAVRQAACTVREVKAGDPRLLGYLVTHEGQTVSDADLRAHLKKTLPDYMVPQHLVRLPKLPLSPAGKIDRKALPDPDLSQRTDDFVAPRTPTEGWLCGVWQELLRVGRVGVTDDFFALGGHSLLAAQLMARLGRERDVKLSLRRLFEAPTVEKLAALIDSRAVDAGAAVVTIPKRPDARTAPQSLMQRRLWYLDQLAGGDISYNAPAAFRIHGVLDVAALERTLAEISRRHESLRTSLDEVGGVPLQRIHDDVRLTLEREELPGIPEGERSKAVAPHLQREADFEFDLRKAPLARAKLFTFAPDDNVLFFMPHHVIWDGWSFDLLLAELSAIYGAFAEGKPSPLPEPEVQYGDFAQWHNGWLTGPELERQAEYWVKTLKPPLPVLEVPGDRPRPTRMSGEGSFEPLFFTRAETEPILRAARRLDATPYMVLLATFEAMLHRYTGIEDLLIGTPVRGRSQPQVEKLLGFFVNTLVLRTTVTADLRFDELVARVKKNVVDSFAYPDMPFELLVERLKLPRDASRTPVYQAMFSFQEATGRDPHLGKLDVTQLHVMAQGAMTDLVLWWLSKKEGLVGGLSYNSDILEASTARRMLLHFKQLLLSVAQDPTQRIADLPLVSKEELDAMQGWNEAARVALPQRKLVHEQVLHQAAATPDAVAVSHGDARLTYRQLAGRAHAIASALRAQGVRPGDRVGLCVERSADMVAAMLGVLETGAAYVPLDPAYPEDRIAFMVDDAKLKAVVTEKRVLDSLELPHGAPRVLLDEVAREAEPPAVGPVDPETPAYVIYTSGSTGKPKGVMVPHRAVTNFLQSMTKQPGLTASDTLLAVTTLSFDIAVLELWLPLTVGARVAVASREDSGEADRLIALMEREKPTVLQATPVTWRMLLDGGWKGDRALKALVGGEALPIDLARRLVEQVGQLWNMYGPTETTVWSTLERVTAPVDRVLIGRPLDNTSLYVLDANGKPVPLGVPGELYIGGEGVTSGYLFRPELTAERFVHDPFAGKPGAVMYRTGDLARFMTDGRVECLGRNDGQVKVRGHRIEVGEIEARLCDHPNVREACVVARDDARGEKRLVAYVVPKSASEPLGTLELRKHARKSLPDYMVPNLFEELPELPRTPNGKVDRKALPAPSSEAQSDTYLAPRSAPEQLVAEVWALVLGVPRAGLADNFFDLGGHSLLAFKAISELERRTGKRVSPRTLMLGTLEQVAKELPAVTATPRGPQPEAPPAQAPTLADRLLGRVKGFVKR